MKTAIMILCALLVITLLVVVIACDVNNGDTEQVLVLIRQATETREEKYWRLLYQHTLCQVESLDNRATCFYEEFKRYDEEAWIQWFTSVGPGQFRATDVHVEIEGEWAYAVYELQYNGDEIYSYTSADPDVFENIGGKWYDIAE